MTRIFVYILLILFTSCEFQNNYSEFDTNVVVDLGSEEFFDQLEKEKGVILDVRTVEEIDNGHLIGASFIDFYDLRFKTKASWIPNDKPIYVYCYGGGRSSKAAEMLINLGFSRVYNLKNGYREWSSSGLPIEKSNKNYNKRFKVFNVKQVKSIISENENTLLVFKTPWCLPCKKLDAVLNQFSLNNQKWKIISLNMDSNFNLAQYYSIKSVPTIIAFNKSDIVMKHSGFLELSELISKLP